MEDYYPFASQPKLQQRLGLTFNSYQRPNTTEQNYQYNGKELQDELDVNWLDYGARMYMADIGRWGVVDPLAEKSISMTPYHYVNNNPIAFLDPDGRDWFYYKNDGDKDAGWHWQDGSTYEHTYTYTGKDGKEKTGKQKLDGVKAAIVFDGTDGENLGEGDNLYGEGAKLANVTVYGPKGAKDIKKYKGYTLSSDPKKYGVVESNSTDWLSDNAYYKGMNYTKPHGLPSFWLLGENGVVPAKDGYNPSNRSSNVVGSFIHSTGKSGNMFFEQKVKETRQTGYNFGVGPTYTNFSTTKIRGVSEGCLIIQRKDWNRFVNQMGGLTNRMSFAVQVLR